MIRSNIAPQGKQHDARTVEARPATPRGAQTYQSPHLLSVGKAVELVQGGGGSYADNNRARQY